MKKAIAAGVLVMGLALTGCSVSGAAPDGSVIPLTSYEIVLQDGRTVACVILHGNSVTCDWERAK